jgi:mannose-6-phosphate isomerase-like protein (cupin superfamily)
MQVAEFWKLDGKTIKDNDVYKLIDNDFILTNLIVSTTTLHPSQNTTGHSHEDQEEVYMFTSGVGIIKIGDINYPAKQGDVFVIPKKHFHKVWNTHDKLELEFICVFEGERKH